MIVDLHSHFFPIAVATAMSDPPVVTSSAGGSLILRVGGHDLVVSVQLADADALAADAASRGLDRRVLMVPPFTVLYELAATLGLDWSRRINDAIAQTAAQHERLLGFATVPLQCGGDVAAEELIRSVRDLGLCGVEVLTSMCGKPLDSPDLVPFWAAADELRIPVFIHPHFVSGADRMSNFHLRNVIGNPTETALTGAQLLFSGLLDRYPALTVILSHGGGALAHLVGRLQHAFEHRAEFHDVSTAPREGLRRFHYDTVIFDAGTLRRLGEVVGFDRLVVGSDYPFDMGEADPVGFIESSGLNPALVAQILHSADRIMPDLPCA